MLNDVVPGAAAPAAGLALLLPVRGSAPVVPVDALASAAGVSAVKLASVRGGTGMLTSFKGKKTVHVSSALPADERLLLTLQLLLLACDPPAQDPASGVTEQDDMPEMLLISDAGVDRSAHGIAVERAWQDACTLAWPDSALRALLASAAASSGLPAYVLTSRLGRLDLDALDLEGPDLGAQQPDAAQELASPLPAVVDAPLAADELPVANLAQGAGMHVRPEEAPDGSSVGNLPLDGDLPGSGTSDSGNSGAAQDLAAAHSDSDGGAAAPARSKKGRLSEEGRS